ncbi:MAG: hypothetical protein IPJ20_22765 [Flammeovirgaceae bacterium]|nr:hypothetical protein [Flammeovirgaceae bacterium]
MMAFYELDNSPSPPWWTGLFVGSILFAIVYLIFYHVSDTLPLATEIQEYETISGPGR